MLTILSSYNIPYTNSFVSVESLILVHTINVWLFLTVSLISSLNVDGISVVSTGVSSNTPYELR